MAYTEDQLWSLLREAADMPYGSAQIALVEQVIAHADALHATELSFRSRMVATNAYTYGGEPAKSFVTFSWCLAAYDKDPTPYLNSTHTLMWHFKYMASALRKFPEIPLDRTHAVLDDMERRWRDGGHSLHAVYAYRHVVASHVGDMATAEQWFQKWHTAKRDDLSDCIGCDPTTKVEWLTSRGRDEEAVALAAPVLAGRMSCTEQPQAILTALLIPYVRTGRLEEARDAHRRAYRLMRPNLADMESIATHVYFCGVTGNEGRGLELVERHLPWLSDAPSPLAAMQFAAASALVLGRLAGAGHGDTVIQRAAAGDRPAGDITVAALATELAVSATGLAARFDARNGTNHQGAQVAGVLGAVPIVAELPLSASRPSVRSGAVPRPTVAVVVAGSETPATAEPIPAGASPDEILTRAERHARFEEDRELAAAVAHFDDRFADVDLSALQRGRRADLHGFVATNAGDLAVAELAWNSALDLFAAAGDDLRRQSTRARIGVLMCHTDRGEVGLPITQDATDFLLDHSPPDRLSSVHQRIAIAYLLGGRGDEAIASLDEAARLADHAEYAMTRVRIAVDRAAFLAQIGRIDEAREAAETARAGCRAAAYPRGLAAACWLLGRLAQGKQDIAGALVAYDEALGAADDPLFIREVRRQRASMLAGSAQAADVIDDLAEEVAAATAAGEHEIGLTAKYFLAMAYLNADRPFDSADVLEDLLATFAATSPQAEPARHMLAQAYQRLEQPDQAIEQLQIIADSGAHRGHRGLVGEMTEQIAQLLDTLDRDALAAKRFGEASVAYGEAEMMLPAVRTARRAAMSHMWAGQSDEAAEALSATDLAALDLDDADAAVRWERAMLAVDGSRILAQVGDLSAAVVRGSRAMAMFQALGDAPAAAFAAVTHGEILLRAGRAAEAEPLLRSIVTANGAAGNGATIARIPGDVPRRAAIALARALDGLGRPDEASEIRMAYELNQ